MYNSPMSKVHTHHTEIAKILSEGKNIQAQLHIIQYVIYISNLTPPSGGDGG
jgi:hypothetical protein